eukprot:CAMPEP_0115022264 /NCGR_PEP_ID=MMETSP0216-20121206/31430_1 /TAXON_ID=223996 /ORGANISM="Protocruzia adherens, Strain Boccale" /LENGTH=295 /DNA_ID=CAMNT_0002394881 /DNA_START=55 /DNA_END=942 /DNA_ORIENTATION=+
MATESQGKYTPEQEAMCKTILGKKDFYDILGVSRQAAEDEIKKNYRKLALKLHPDKNQAPSSTEAFKTVSKAFACLSDAEKRKYYDTYGEEHTTPGRPQGRHAGAAYYYEDEFDPDELFRMFFGGNVFAHQGGIYRRQYRRQQPNRQQAQHGNLSSLLQLLPIFLLLLMSFINNWANPDLSTYYSFNETRTHQVQKVSKNFSVSYYIDQPGVDSFRSPKDVLRQIDNEVEEAYVHNLKRECYQKTSYRDRMNAAARYYGKSTERGREYVDKAQGVDLSPCHELNDLMPRGYRGVY